MQKDEPKRIVRIVAISDTHDKHKLIDINSLPPADIFIHAGDFTRKSRKKQFQNFRQFIQKLPYKHKVVIAGNHDFGLDTTPHLYQQVSDDFMVKPKERVIPLQQIQKIKKICTYLHHQYVEIEGVRIFGSPYVNANYKMGFTYPDIQGQKIWSTVPQNIDILVTHCPPHNVLDKINNGMHVGCKFLAQTVKHIRPKLHIFGHIHESSGHLQMGQTHYYNVAFLNQFYKQKNQAILIELELRNLEPIKQTDGVKNQE